MCCNDKKVDGQTQMQGMAGQPVGFEVDPADFMNPGMGFGAGDVLGSIYAKMGLPEEGEEEMYA